ncbi:hypothetical protein AAHC03_017110 [Spirometra sp. Aus1]
MIGENQALYEKTLCFLREECLRLQATVERSNSQRKPSTTLPDACLQPPPKKSRESSSSSKKIKKEESSVPDLEPKSSPPVPFISSALLPNPQSMAATALCTVRFDLLMSFNEARQDQLCIADPIHHFVWCMDACIRNKKIDRRHVCELVYHLNRHRRRSSVRHGLESEVGLDQDTSADWAPDSDEKALTKKKTADVSLRFPRHQRTGEKRGPGTSTDPDDDAFGSTPKLPRVGEVGPPENSYERDLQMICRDPCTVYTICSSLLRLVMSGLYEDKLPRNIPEVNFLVHLLMIGLEADLTPPEPVSTTAPVSTVSSSKSEVKHKHGHKRTASDDSVVSVDGATETPVSPAVYLITQVLPAVGQLQVAAWRAEVGEKIRHISGNIWADAWSPQTDPAPTQSSSRPSASWQRRLEIASPFTVSVPPAYLSHPVGNLFLQYHCLFALERREWVVLRALLKAAAGAAQQQARASKAAARAAASSTGKSTAAPLSPVAGSSGGFGAASVSPSYGFRWRPECLQALALGIAALPVSSDEASSKAPTLHGAGGSSSSGVAGSGGTGMSVSAAERTGVAVGADNHPSSASIKLSRSASTGSSDHTKVSSPIKQSQSPAVTRAELASLLRASLPLQNDLQLLVLALLSRLVPGTTAGGAASGSTGASQPSATPMPSYFSSTSAVAINPALSSQLSERERLINTLSRHCNFATESQPLPSTPVSTTGFDQTAELAGASASTAVDSVALTTAGLSATTTGGTVASTAGAVYRTSNPKVLEALEVLRRDFERTTPNLMPLLTKMGSSSSTGGPLGSSGKHATPTSPSAQTGPMSPFSSQMSAPPGYGLSSTRLYNFEGGLSSPTGGFRPPSASSSLRSTLGRYATPSMEAQGYQHNFASPRAPPRYGASSSYNQFPMATPFTNPGLASSSSVMPPPPALPSRLPVSPPPDYRPPSPATYSTDRPPLLMADEPAYSQSAGVAGSISPPTADLRRYAAPPVNMAMKPHSPPPESPPPGEGTEGYT